MNKEQSEIQQALAEARYNDARGAMHEDEVARKRIEDNFTNANDLRNRYIEFVAEIDTTNCVMLNQMLRRLHRLDPGKPITIEMHSPGGSISDGMRTFDEILRIRNEGTEVIIRARGEVCSMGSILLQAATRREIGPNARIMLHRASFGTEGTTADVEDQVELAKRLEEQIYRILESRTGITAKQWKAKLGKRKDVWWDANEALKEGLVDAIV